MYRGNEIQRKIEIKIQRKRDQRKRSNRWREIK